MNAIRRIIPLIVLCLPACSADPDRPRPDAPRPRVVSFSPALTDLLFDMGLGDHVVGVTAFCAPGELDDEPMVVGDAENVSTEGILAAEGDIILTQSDRKLFEGVRRADAEVRIEQIRIEQLADIAAAMERIGRLVGKPAVGARAAGAFREALDALASETAGLPERRALFVMGHEHPVVAGSGTFIDEMIRLAGGVNAGTEYAGWKGINQEVVISLRPEVLICQSPPALAEAARAYWRSIDALRERGLRRIYVVTDPRWTIPSARMAAYAGELSEMVHPEAIGAADGGTENE